MHNRFLLLDHLLVIMLILILILIVVLVSIAVNIGGRHKFRSLQFKAASFVSA